MKRIDLEYGQTTMAVDLPDGADVFVPGETVPDPPALPDPAAATRASLRSPLGMPPLSRLVRPGSSVTIVFPDRVKGGSQETAHRKVAIPLVIEECLAAGARRQDIRLVCSNGLHRKNTAEEIKILLGDAVFNEFWPSGQIENHDSEDPENLLDLGTDEMGDPVFVNRRAFESDVAVLVGHVLGNPYGGYSGGYKHAATGITNWKSIASHHIPEVMHRADFTPVSTGSLMRRKFDAIGRHMEVRRGRDFFVCDAVLDTQARQIAVFSGSAREVQRASWEIADRRTLVPWATRKYDIMVFGMPQAFHYGNGHGTNPILILQAIAANVIRHKRILADGCAVICASLCNGFFNDVEFPSYREVYELFQKDGHDILPDIARYGEEFARRKEYIKAYRFRYGYHPFHAFSMISCGHIAEQHCGGIYIVGAEKPAYARGMGMKTRATFGEALEEVKRRAGRDLSILALPRTFKTAAVHLAMKG